MTEQQKIHIAMINSYNVIVGNVDIDDVLDSNVSLFSHDFEEELQYDNMVFILKYFEQIEMFDKCIILSAFIDKTFDKTGKHKEKACECPYPEIELYEAKTKCSTCKRKLKR
jgi:hypothetical protein